MKNMYMGRGSEHKARGPTSRAGQEEEACRKEKQCQKGTMVGKRSINTSLKTNSPLGHLYISCMV